MMHKFNWLKYILPVMVLFLNGCSSKDLNVDRREAYQAYEAGEYEAAAGKFEQLVGVVPKDAELWFRLGNSYARAKSPKKAVIAYENALLRDPEMGKAWYNMGMVYMQAALKSFVDMERYIAEDDPVAIQGKVFRKGLFNLMEEPVVGNDQEE